MESIPTIPWSPFENSLPPMYLTVFYPSEGTLASVRLFQSPGVKIQNL